MDASKLPRYVKFFYYRISLPSNNGAFDYRGFLSSDSRAISFCRDIFNHYWQRVRIIPRFELNERHLEYCHYYGIYQKYP